MVNRCKAVAYGAFLMVENLSKASMVQPSFSHQIDRMATNGTESQNRPSGKTERRSDSFVDPGLWKGFREAASMEEFAKAWISLQCQIIPQVYRGTVFLGSSDEKPTRSLVSWPEGEGESPGLAEISRMVIEKRCGVVTEERNMPVPGKKSAHLDMSYNLAYPLLIENHLYAVVAVEIANRSQNQLGQAMRQLQWGMGWLEVSLRRYGELGTFEAANAPLSMVIQSVATCLEQNRFQDAATALVTELATTLS